MSFNKVSHVIFDLDGLLLDTESIYEEVIGGLAAEHGKKYTKEIKLKIMGTTEINTARIAVKEMDLPFTPEDLHDVYLERAKEALKHPKLMPGAKKLVEHLHSKNIPIAIATSSGQGTYDIKTQDHKDLMKLFDHIVCGSTDPDVKHGKPAPDIFLVTAGRFTDKPNPEKCLVLEDAPNGAKGAVSAGMQVVLVPHPDIPDDWRKPATLVLNSLEEFKPEEFGLPPF